MCVLVCVCVYCVLGGEDAAAIHLCCSLVSPFFFPLFLWVLSFFHPLSLVSLLTAHRLVHPPILSIVVISNLIVRRANAQHNVKRWTASTTPVSILPLANVPATTV